jgi:hypothetical protein
MILLVSIISLVAFTPVSSLRESSTQDSTKPQLRSNIADTTESEVNDGIVTKNEVPSTVNASSDASQVFYGPYFDVTPSAVPITALGETFTVAVALHNVTVEDAPAGLEDVEVVLTWNSSLVEPVNVRNDIGVPDVGVLWGPVFFVFNGFYDNNCTDFNSAYALSAPYTGAMEYAVGAGTLGVHPWWSTNSTGTVALITFRVKSAPTSQFTVCSLQLGNQTELIDDNINEVSYNLVSPLILGISSYYPANEELIAEAQYPGYYILSTYYPANEGLIVDAEVQYASYCVLSYAYNYSGRVSDWINETMTKDGNSYNGTIYTSPILGETSVQYRVFAYDCFGRSSESAISLFETDPVIGNVSDNLRDWGVPESGVVILDAVVQYADHCVLSYMYDNAEGKSSGWISETMAKDGNNYTGIIDCSPIPYHTIVQYEIVAYDSYGQSSEPVVSWFAKSNGEETGLWILNVSDDFSDPSNPSNSPPDPVTINAVVYDADQCVLSWFNGTNWVNETMIKNGTDYTGTAGLFQGWTPDLVSLDYQVTAYDSSGNSTQTAIVSNSWYPSC